jgi:hypothetical protein
LDFFATFPSRSVNVIVSVAFSFRAFFNTLRCREARRAPQARSRGVLRRARPSR